MFPFDPTEKGALGRKGLRLVNKTSTRTQYLNAHGG